MSKPIPDIVKEWISKINVSQLAKNLTTLDGVSTFETCNTWWAVKCGYVIINDTEYEITNVIQDESITIQGQPIVNGDFTFNLKVPFFIHGTPTKANQERELIRPSTVVTPMIYLFEPIREDFNEITNPIERSTSLRIALLNNYKEEQFTNDIYDFSIRAMRKLTERFVYTIRKQLRQVNPDTVNYNIISYAKYGNFITNKGVNKNLFNENLSGVELNINIDLKRINNCCKFD